ncbi:selenocysteine-specific translation elongation factor [Kribbella hippodromi]|uniref:selenocysteine-specific translation elongation factor n=1 Tax=Kribbella hippodromi TaxID=434347 RepID=UPI0031E2B10D
MQVVATAGHVDHGKSSLVRALTGADPDRLAEERRRGLTIELGYCWTELPGAGQVAFVDVPGHERFIQTTLAGVGPVPAVLFVVAADDDWMPQATEHLAALDAFGVRHAVLAVTRSDLADPRPATERAITQLNKTSLRGARTVAVSTRTGVGLNELREALAHMVNSLPRPTPTTDVRLWVDRCFTVRGAGTIVTGTLPAGTITAGDHLSLGDETVRVRGIESLGQPCTTITGPARVALNLGSKPPRTLGRSSVLTTPYAWHHTTVADLRVTGLGDVRRPDRMTLHLGAVAQTVHVRPLNAALARIALPRALPLRIGDRAILRDPGNRAILPAIVVDPAPPPLGRRGAAARRAVELSAADGTVDPTAEVRRRALVAASLLRQIGVDPAAASAVRAGDWVLSREHATTLRDKAIELIRTESDAPELGLSLAVVARHLDLPEPDLVRPLIQPPLRLAGGAVVIDIDVPSPAMAALARLIAELTESPFAAPDASRLRTLGLNEKVIAAAVRAGRLVRLDGSVLLLPGADQLAARLLSELPQPFTVSQARECLGVPRRIAVPILEQLDRIGRTRRLPDNRHVIRDQPDSGQSVAHYGRGPANH